MAIPKLQAYVLPTALDVPVNKVDWAFDFECTVLLIHDMQGYFIGFWGDNCPMMEQIVTNIVALCQYRKEYNIPVYYTVQPKEQSDEDRALLNDMQGPGLTHSPEQQKTVEALVPDEADTILAKWCYSVSHCSPSEQMLKETGRNRLIIIGVYTHIDCMITATDAFMHDIKPFMVADALADFSRDEHLISLKYMAGCSGRVVMVQELLPTPVPTSKDVLHSVILPLLGESEEPVNDKNLIDYGLDSVHMMALVARWHKAHDDIDSAMLAKKLVIDAWWALLSREVK